MIEKRIEILKKSCLYVVATPIGNLGDITLRALEILKSVDLILAEDTRHSKRLLNHFGIQTPTLSFHDHNERTKIDAIVAELKTGKSIALISDAGTPLINDPGFHLVRTLKMSGYPVVPIPGPSALIAALSVCGLPSDRFCFEGFLPHKKTLRRARLESLSLEPRTLIFYEAPHRVSETLEDLSEIFGSEREAVLARELTKTFETIRLGSLLELTKWLQEDENHERGEIVILVKGHAIAAKSGEASDEENQIIDQETVKTLKILLAELPISQAASIAAKITGIPKRILYDKALKLG